MSLRTVCHLAPCHRSRILPCLVVSLLAVSFLGMTAGCERGSLKSAPARTSAVSGQGADSSLHALAWRLRDEGAPADSFMAVQRRAVARLRAGKSPVPAVSVLEQMGFFHYIVGALDSAMMYYNEASDSLELIPRAERPAGAIQFFGDLALLYDRLGMSEEALQYSDSAEAESRRHGGAMMSDVLRFRAGIWHGCGEPDSALRCYDRAIASLYERDTVPDREMLRNIILREKGYFLLEYFKDRPDSVKRGVALLEHRGADDSPDGQYDDDPYNQVSLGYGYVLSGRPDEGFAMMERGAETARGQADLDLMNYAYTKLLEQYAAQERWGDVGRVYPLYREANDSITSLREKDLAIGAKVRYEVLDKERTIEMQRLQLLAAREHTVMVILAALLALMVLGIASVVVWRRYAAMRRRRDEEVEHLSRMVAGQQARVQVLETDLSAGRDSNNEILSEPQLITGEKTGVFRRAFTVLYPDFLGRMRDVIPKLTPNDELLCMLIFLGHTTDEIATYLGISRASVNSARYRLRKKIGMDKEGDLDSFIRHHQ